MEFNADQDPNPLGRIKGGLCSRDVTANASHIKPNLNFEDPDPSMYEDFRHFLHPI
jgi:hypothetical protein